MIDHFRMGFANRTLGYRLPRSNRVTGAGLRSRLQKSASTAKATRTLNGSVVIPIFDLAGEVVQMYGRKATRITKLRRETGTSLSAGPAPRRVERRSTGRLKRNHPVRGADRRADVLVAGYRHVTASYGVTGSRTSTERRSRNTAQRKSTSLTTATTPAKERRCARG